MTTKTFLSCLLASYIVFSDNWHGAFAFIPSSAQHHSKLVTDSTRASSLFAAPPVQVVMGGESDPRVLDVASFRNGCKNPEMVVAQAEEKNGAIDKSEAALNGAKIGALYIGPIVGVGTYMQSGDVALAASNYGIFGVGVGALLAGNSLLGKSIHVPSVPEAKNRIIVDYSEGLLRQFDIGFVALSEESKFAPCGGVMGAVDVQLRNSPKSPSGVRKVANLPTHLHIKNMFVDESQRRLGVGKALIDGIEKYAAEAEDVKMLTLEVREDNPAGLNLYKRCGFEERENPQKMRIGNLFMVKEV